MILKDILETVGNTPIVKLNKIGNSLKCNLFVTLKTISILCSLFLCFLDNLFCKKIIHET